MILICACVPYGAPGFTPGTGYQLQLCPKCYRRCWVGPTQAGAILAGIAVLRCMICVARELAGEMRVRTLDPNCNSKCDEAAMQDGLDGMDVEELG